MHAPLDRDSDADPGPTDATPDTPAADASLAPAAAPAPAAGVAPAPARKRARAATPAPAAAPTPRVRRDPLLIALRGPAEELPDFTGCPSLWICLRGRFAIDGPGGPFLLRSRDYLTLPGNARPALLPGYAGLGVLLAAPPALFGRAVLSLQPRLGLQRAPFALRSRAPWPLVRFAFRALRDGAGWSPGWYAFQCVQLMHDALAAQTEIGHWLARAPGRAESQRRDALQRLIHARNRILNCPFEAQDIDALALEADYSKSHFIKAFRDVFGKTPGALLVEARIRMAKQLIAQGALSIGEIAKDIGYGSRCSFARSFKTHTGVNASVFRKERRPRRRMVAEA